jgi:hypothetical protein
MQAGQSKYVQLLYVQLLYVQLHKDLNSTIQYASAAARASLPICCTHGGNAEGATTIQLHYHMAVHCCPPL